MKIVEPVPASDEAAPELSLPEQLLLQNVPAGSRVATLNATASVERALWAARCEVLTLAPASAGDSSLDTIARFAPSKILVCDAGRCGLDLTEMLRGMARSAPAAEVYVSFWNATAASALIEALAGQASARVTMADEVVRSSLVESGYSLGPRQAWVEEGAPRFFSEDVEQALRRLFLQLNPAASDTWVTYTGRRAVSAPRAQSPIVPGLLSVVIRNHTVERLPLVDQTVFSLACQSYRPLEIVLVSQSRDPDAVQKLTSVLELHKHVAGYAYQVIAEPAANDIRGKLLNVGIAAARGQYLAFLDDDDVVYPHHYRRLIDALQRGSAAWSISRTRTARFTFDAGGALYCKSKNILSAHEEFSLPDLVRENYIAAHAYVLDRLRLGRFPVGFSEEITRTEDYVLLLRLAACFRPAYLPDAASCEYRIRDDGSNSNMMSEQPDEVRTREQLAWASARHAREKVKRPLQMLLSMGEYEDHLRLAAGGEMPVAIGVPRRPPPLRHRLVDALNEVVKRAIPRAHAPLKRLAERLARGRN